MHRRDAPSDRRQPAVGRSACVAIALLSGITALAWLMLPLLLVLLMALFDIVAGSLLVLIGLLVSWIQDLLPGVGSSLRPYKTIEVQPMQVAVHALLRSLPCLIGLLLIVLDRQRRGRWRWVLPLWGLAAATGGPITALLLLPGLLVACLFSILPAPPGPGLPRPDVRDSDPDAV